MLPKRMLSGSFTAANKMATNLLKRNDDKRASSILARAYAKSSFDDDDDELNKPLKYTSSPAHDWKASHSRIGSKAEFGPWYEPHIVSFSLIAFMVYFFIMREENDLDQMLERPLTDTLKKD